MSEGVRRAATWALSEMEAAVDWVRRHARRAAGRGPYRVALYAGHGTAETLYVRGRVLQGEPIPPASEHDGAWRNLVNTLRRLESDEVPAARVRVHGGGGAREVMADDEGYFEVALEVSEPLAPRLWHPVHVELLDPVAAEGPARAEGRVLVPPPGAAFGVISDIDDTVVRTDATHVLSMLRLVFLTNARTRLPFAGVAAFYRALARGVSPDAPPNPIFYVSSSPWSLSDLLEEVFEVHGVPAGPVFLRDYGISREMLFATSHEEHKLGAIERILATHPDLSFVLVGDTGQRDPEIYREVARRHPGRVRAVYLRDVTAEGRDAEVGEITKELDAEGVQVVVAGDTVTAAVHAAGAGLIDPASLPEIRGERARDRSKPGPLEEAIRP